MWGSSAPQAKKLAQADRPRKGPDAPAASTTKHATVGAQQQCHVLLYQPLSGDGQITARVVSQQNTDPWALAGVMIRESLTPSSPHALAAVTPDHGFSLTSRSAASSASDYEYGGAGGAPAWLRLTRSGNTFSADRSVDGTGWTNFGSMTIPMGTNAYIGLAVTSHNNAELATDTFDNVRVEKSADNDVTPPGISAIAVGTVNQNGASISWLTDEAADSQVEYGSTDAYGLSTTINRSLLTNHTVVVSGLDPDSTYHYRIKSRDAAGNESTSVDLTFRTPATPVTLPQSPPIDLSPKIELDQAVGTKQTIPSDRVSAPPFGTTSPNELLVAFIATDGPSSTGHQVREVTGGGVVWTLRARANDQAGTSEIWTASPTDSTTDIVVTAAYDGSYASMINVVVFRHAGVGQTGSASGATGAPSAQLTPTGTDSWVWAVGNDWDRAIARTPGPNQVKVDELLTDANDTFWLQRQADPTAQIGVDVTMNSTAPSGDRWNMSLIEIVAQ